MPRLAEGLAKAGRRRENYEISGGGFLATGPDDATVARMFEWVRERVALLRLDPGLLAGLCGARARGSRPSSSMR